MSDLSATGPRSARFTGSITRNVVVGGPISFTIPVERSDWQVGYVTWVSTTQVSSTLGNAGRRGVRFMISRGNATDVGEYIGDYTYPAVFYSSTQFSRQSENLLFVGSGNAYLADCFFSGNDIFAYMIRTSGSGNVTLSYTAEVFR